MRRTLAILAAALALQPPAVAQDEGAVRLVLFRQTPVATADHPFEIRVGAVNESPAPYSDLQLTVAVYAAVGSRSEYGQTLTAGSTSPVAAEPRSLRGALEPGVDNGRSFPSVELPMSGTVNALHPVTVELRADGGLTPLAVLRTSVLFIAEDERPEVPLNVSLSFVLDEPVRTRPDGVHLDEGLETSLAAGGRLETIVAALEQTPVPATLVLSPLLLDELRRMADGYRVQEGDTQRSVPPGEAGAAAATGMLERLRALAARVEIEVVALPFASPSIPALVDADLGEDLRVQIERGRQVVAEILATEPSTTVFRPPGSSLSPAALDVLALLLRADGQLEPLLVDAEVLAPPEGLTLSPPGAALLDSATGDLPVIAPDPILEDRTEAVPNDPALAAMWTLGELAALYLEQPSIDRGAAIVFSEDEAPSPPFLRTLLRGLRPEPDEQWVRLTSNPNRVVAAETGPEDPPLALRDLQHSSRSTIVSEAVTATLGRAKSALSRLEAIEASPALVEQIRRNLLVAESRYLLGRESLALEFLSAARASVAAEFAKIRPPDTDSEVTLTSRSGTIPLTIRNEADYPVRVRVTLGSTRLQFLGGASRDLVLEPPGASISFPVRAQTTGRFPVAVQVRTPDGGGLVAESSIVVRSTAYNRVALAVTIGAALFLALWWGRRFLPRWRD